MILSLIFFFLFIHTSSSSSSLCIHTQSHWLNNKWPSVMIQQNVILSMENLTICNTSYKTIMNTESLKMTLNDNRLWVTSFHHYCTAQLNRVKIMSDLMLLDMNSTNDGYIDPSQTMMLDQLSYMISIIGDSLERTCDDMKSYQYLDNPSIYLYLDVLHLLNIGAIPGIQICNTSSNQIDQSSLYYRHNPDLIIIPFINDSLLVERESGSGSNTSTNITSIFEKYLMYSLLDDTYRTKMFLFGFLLVSLTLNGVLLSIILFIRDKKRECVTHLRIVSDVSGNDLMISSTTDDDGGGGGHKNPLHHVVDDYNIELGNIHISSDDDGDEHVIHTTKIIHSSEDIVISEVTLSEGGSSASSQSESKKKDEI